MSDERDRSGGMAAALLGLILLWFAVWTILCNALVLSGTSYAVLVWCLPVATILTILIALFAFPRMRAAYEQGAPAAADLVATRRRPYLAIALLAFGLVGAFLLNKVQSAALLVQVMAGLSFLAWWIGPAGQGESRPVGRSAWLGIGLLVLILCALYYFGSWPDWDDANFINLALGAQRTHGLVFQLDTMLGDGPGPLHLPTYRFHSFELLGAALSSWTGLQPITAIHLLMPLPQLIVLALILSLVLRPVAGRQWFAAALFALAFQYAVTEALGTWGVHGLMRFYTGKGFLVTALVPLAGALTLRWMLRREKIDLVALLICHICAIGCSANGLYVTPLASAAVAAAMVAGRPQAWRETLPALLWLAPTLTYTIIIAATGAVEHLYLPSEVGEITDAYQEFRFVTGWGVAGLLALALLPLLALAVKDRRLRIAAAIFVPLMLALILNPLGWHITTAVTGNLGFRFFWAIPAAIIAGLALEALSRHVIGPRPMLVTGLAAVSLLGAIVYNARFVDPAFRVTWGWPGLKVRPDDYALAQWIARESPPGCTVLVPERASVWLATMPGAPYPAFVRSLYLKHYRFTMPARKLAVRKRLFDLEEGAAPTPPPSRAELKDANIAIGMIVTQKDSPAERNAATLAKMLNLQEYGTYGRSLVYWRGACKESARN